MFKGLIISRALLVQSFTSNLDQKNNLKADQNCDMAHIIWAIWHMLMNFGEKKTLLQIRLYFTPKFLIIGQIEVLVRFQILRICISGPDLILNFFKHFFGRKIGPHDFSQTNQNSTILIWNCIEHLAFWF